MKLFWDASALVKRYCQEPGSEQVNRIFQSFQSSHFLVSEIGILEIVSIFIRKKNDGRITQEVFNQAMLEFGNDVIVNPDFHKTIFQVQPIVVTTNLLAVHQLNSVDAVLLHNALELNQTETLTLITADRRLAVSAQQEQLRVLNPETVSSEELSLFLQFGTSQS